MLKPYLFVGVGGSGGKTLRYLYREMERRLRAGGWDGPPPGAWGFLHIDVPDQPDGREVTDIPPGTLEGPDHYLGLAKQQTYSSYDTILNRSDAFEKAVDGWKPDPDPVKQVWLGAKQIRGVGRAMALSNFAAMHNRIESAYNGLSTPSHVSALERYAAQVGSQMSTTPQVVLVSSLGGGAGSGIFLEAMELIRLIVEPVEPLSILYSPEIFDDLDQEAGAGIAPNSLAALSELISGFEHEGPLHPSEEALLGLSGVGRVSRGRRTFLQNLLIGARNQHLRLPNGPAVFRATGKALASFVMNPDISATFGTYLTANQRSAVAQRSNRTTSVMPAAEAPFSSFGYASVGLGRPLFNEYAAQRLASAALLRLRRGHVDDAPLGEVVDDDAAVRQRVDREFQGFLERCRLHERGREANEVLDALRSKPDVERRWNEFIKEQSQAFNEKWGKDAARAQADRIKTFLSPPRDQNAMAGSDQKSPTDRLYDQLLTESHARAIEWVREIQPAVVQQVADAIGSSGLLVAAGLVDRLRVEMLDVAKELRLGATKSEDLRASRIREMGAGFNKAARRQIGANHPLITAAFKKYQEAQVARYEADLERLAASVLEDFAAKFLRPLSVSLDDSLDQLRQVMAPTGSGSSSYVVAGWPTEVLPGVPASLTPALNEVLLIPTAQFPDDFEMLLQRQYALIDDLDDAAVFGGYDEALDLAIDDVLTGSWIRHSDAGSEDPDQTLIEQNRRWIAEVGELLRHSSDDSPRAAQFTLDIRPIESLLARSRDWVRNARGPAAEHASESLKDYLANPRKKIERADAFVEKLARAFQLAEPLLELDEDVYAQRHANSGASALSHVVSSVPLTQDHEAYERVADVLVGALGQRGLGAFDSGSTAQEIEIAAFLSIAVGPLPLDGMGESIISGWGVAKQEANLRSEWWHDRRSRRLPSFIPMTPDLQAAFLRGWVTGQILGQIPDFDGERLGPWEVWSPDGILRFDDHVLGHTPVDQTEEPLALLETLPLVLMLASVGDSSHLAAYERVIELGTSKQPEGATLTPGYPNPSEALTRWIEEGRVEDPRLKGSGGADAPIPREQLASTSDADPDARRAAVMASFDLFRRRVGEIGDLSWDEVVATRQARRTWEMADEFQSALRTAIDALDKGRRTAPVRVWG